MPTYVDPGDELSEINEDVPSSAKEAVSHLG